MSAVNRVGLAVVALSQHAEAALAIKATIALLLGLCAMRMLRPARASRRHATMAIVFAVLAVLPVGMSLAAPLTVYLATAPTPAVAAETVVIAGANVPHAPSPVDAPHTRAVSSTDAERKPAPWILLVRVAWLMGTVVVLLPVVSTWRWMRQLRRASEPWPALADRATVLASSQGIRQRVTVRRTASLDAPLAWGLTESVVFVPASAMSWVSGDVDRALIHELEHVRRRDTATQMLARVICAFYWWNPLVWAAWSRLRIEADRACDDAVAMRGDADLFAQQLVSLAHRMSGGGLSSVPAMAARRGLSLRVGALLDRRQARGRVGVRWVSSVAALAMLGAGTLASVRVASMPATVTSLATTAPADRTLAVESAVAEPVRPTDSSTGGAAVSAAASPAPAGVLKDRVTTPQVASTLNAQAADGNGGPVSFESISIRESTGARIPIHWQGARLVMSEIPLRTLLMVGYGVAFHEVTDLPDWVQSVRYEIDAVASRPPAASEERRFIRELVEQRFGVRTRTEMQEQPVYTLVLHRPDGRLGPGLRPTQVDCLDVLRRNGVQSNAAGWPDCSMLMDPARAVYMRKGIPIALLADALTAFLRTPVVDRTELSGTFDVNLQTLSTAAEADAAARDGATPLFGAVEEQLGLRLEPGRAAFPKVVFEQIERPRTD